MKFYTKPSMCAQFSPPQQSVGQSFSSRRPNAPMPPAALYVIFSGTQRPHAAGQDSDNGIVESSRLPKAPIPAARASFSISDESHLPSALISVQVMPTLIFISASGVSTHGPSPESKEPNPSVGARSRGSIAL